MFALSSFWKRCTCERTYNTPTNIYVRPDPNCPAHRNRPTVWMEAECEDCPFRCPECDSDLTEYIHDGWECKSCGVVF